MAALREQIEITKSSSDAANGKVRQLESEREDREETRGSTPAGEGRTPAGDKLPAEDATPGAYFDRTRAPSPFPSMAHVTNARAKESLAAWRNFPILKCWTLIGERPTVANLKRMKMQSLLRGKMRVTTGVLEQLNAMSEFRVRSYIAEGDDPHLTRTTLIEHGETLVDAVLTLLSLGIESEDGTTRLEILRQRFRNGTDLIRDHCRQHWGKNAGPRKHLGQEALDLLPRSWPQARRKPVAEPYQCNYASGFRSWCAFRRLISSDKFVAKGCIARRVELDRDRFCRVVL